MASAPGTGDGLHVLFIQGAGAGTHDDWDNRLVDSLRRALGDGVTVLYPRMPDEDDPRASSWGPVIRDEVWHLRDGDVVVGHSVGGTILLHVLAQEPPPVRLGGIVLIAAPYVGDGGWPADEFTFGADLGARLSGSVPVHMFHGLEDDTVPPAHADLFAAAIPSATIHRLAGRDHQLNGDLAEVAAVIAD
jgi:predicted alpha/beta hydrolase family esterase